MYLYFLLFKTLIRLLETYIRLSVQSLRYDFFNDRKPCRHYKFEHFVWLRGSGIRLRINIFL